MERVTIKLIDTQAQVEYREELAKYGEKTRKLMEDMKPWPMDLRPPKPPEDLADSRDFGEDKFAMGPMGSMPCNPGDPSVLPTDRIVLDGTSQQKVEGFDSRWNFGRDDDKKPFTKPKKG